MTNLFAQARLDETVGKPLAERLRPSGIDDIIGQTQLTGEHAFLRKALAKKSIPSLILWGPPGTGKTTMARILARESGLEWAELSAIFAGVADLKKVFAEAKTRRQIGQGTLLFIDEIHRFNKAQQDALLPVIEDGTIIFIGATTENPSFSLVSPLLSRARVITFERLSSEALLQVLERAQNQMQQPLPLTHEAKETLANMADGDARALLTLLDDILRATSAQDLLTPEQVVDLVQKRAPLFDKGGEGHYNLISALHKAVRGSDPDAALYYLSRMLDAGEDPRFIARRLIRMATEDIGLATPQALPQAIAAAQTYEQLGSPEGELALAQITVFLALAEKSNAVYVAYKQARASAQEHGSLMPPKHILNAPTSFMKNQGYGKGYIYDHDTPLGVSGQNYFPDELPPQAYYNPTGKGQEMHLKAKLEDLRKLREQKK